MTGKGFGMKVDSQGAKKRTGGSVLKLLPPPPLIFSIRTGSEAELGREQALDGSCGGMRWCWRGKELASPLEVCGEYHTAVGPRSTSRLADSLANSAQVRRAAPRLGRRSGRQGWRPMEGGPSASEDGHLSRPWPTFQSPFLLPSNRQPPARSHSCFSHQPSVRSSFTITPSFLPLGSEAQRGTSLA